MTNGDFLAHRTGSVNPVTKLFPIAGCRFLRGVFTIAIWICQQSAPLIDGNGRSPQAIINGIGPWFANVKGGVSQSATSMYSTSFLVIAIAAILFEALLLFIAFFEPSLPYKIKRIPQLALDSPEFQRLLEILSDAHILPKSQVEVLANGECFYEAELEAIQHAQHSIHMEAYIFQHGEIAQRFLDALTERARAGVEVRIVLDTIGSFGLRRKYTQALEQAGGQIGWYHSLRWHELPYINNRTHRELIIVDARVGFLGGAGIADNWWIGKKEHPRWRDTMFRVTGEAVAGLQSAFAENWLESTGEVLADPAYYGCHEVEGGIPALIVNSSPSAGRGTRARMLFQMLLASARTSIQITTPYFLPDVSVRGEIIKAMNERGVKVQIIVPGKRSDHILTRRSSRRLYGDLLAAGAEIYEYEPAMIHVKALIIDGLWSVVGSTNFDHRSFGLNDEVNLAVCCSSVAADLQRDFAHDLANSRTVSYAQWRRRPAYERLSELFGWLLERQQ